jgi:hypothetical protein
MSGPTPGRKARGLYGGIQISSNEPSVPSLTALQQTEIPATSSAPASLTITGSTGTVQNEEEGTSGVSVAPTPAPGNLTSSTLAHRVLKAVSRSPIPQNDVFQASWKRRQRWWKEGSAFVSIGVHTESFSPRHSVIYGNQSRNLSTLSLTTIHSVPCILLARDRVSDSAACH